MLLEKDTTLSRYQDLLKTERLEHSKSCSEHSSEIDNLKFQREELNKKIKERDLLVEELKEKLLQLDRLGDVQVMKPSTGIGQFTENDIEKGSQEIDEDDREMSLIDSNKFIDEVFIDESKEFELAEKQIEIQELEGRLERAEEEIRRLQNQLMEVSKRESGWENVLEERDREIETLSRRLKEGGKHGSTTSFVGHTADVDQLRDLLEEKDRHINDLTETLTHFHVSCFILISFSSIDKISPLPGRSTKLYEGHFANLSRRHGATHFRIESLRGDEQSSDHPNRGD